MWVSHHDALICDFAEYYRIYDLRSYEIGYIATLACGLPPQSRTMMALNNQKYGIDTILTASIVDTLTSIQWMFSKAAKDNPHNHPERVLDYLLGKVDKEENRVASYSSGEEFERARKAILGVQNG